MLLGSFVLLSIFAVANRRTPGFGADPHRGRPQLPRDRGERGHAGLGAGPACLRARATRSAISPTRPTLREASPRRPRGPWCSFLGDVIGLPPPVAQAISVGDIFTYGGVAVVIAAGMRRKPEEDGCRTALVAEGDRMPAAEDATVGREPARRARGRRARPALADCACSSCSCRRRARLAALRSFSDPAQFVAYGWAPVVWAVAVTVAELMPVPTNVSMGFSLSFPLELSAALIFPMPARRGDRAARLGRRRASSAARCRR